MRIRSAQSQLAQSRQQLESMRLSLASYERTLREIDNKEKELRAIIDTAADGIVCIDENGIVESVNSAALKLISVIASKWKDALANFTPPFHMNYVHRYLQFAARWA